MWETEEGVDFRHGNVRMLVTARETCLPGPAKLISGTPEGELRCGGDWKLAESKT